MKKLIYLSASCVTVLSLMSCSTKIVKKERLDQLKNVAIIGLDLEQQKAVSGGDLINAAMKKASSGQMIAGVRVDSIHMKSVYQELAEKISRKTGWKLMGLDEMRSNKAYAQIFKDKTEGFQSRPFINERFDLYTSEGVLDTFAVDRLSEDTLKSLAKSLRVDAVVTVKSIVRLNNSSMLASLVGKGEFHPSSNLFMRVLDGVSAEKIFFEAVEGPEVATGEKNFMGMAPEKRLNEMAKEATALSADTVIKDL